MHPLLSRFIYFGYYLKQTDWQELRRYLEFLKQSGGYARTFLMLDAIRSTFRYNIAIEDYFYFRFFEKGHASRQTYAGTGFMYEFHRDMNPVGKRELLHNKLRFLEAYAPFIRHRYCTINDVETESESFRTVLASTQSKLVLKDALGQCGWGVDVVDATMGRGSLVRLMRERGYNLVEQYVEQHPRLAELSPSGLNTVRIVTLLDDNDNVHILGAILRMTVNSFVDNIAMGNIAAPIDLETGKLTSEGVYKDIMKPAASVHPVTGKELIGFQVPFWNEVLEMVEKAALHEQANRSIGWDVAITEEGPSLIEGNHNWCKLLWQLPYREGLKHRILDYYRPGR